MKLLMTSLLALLPLYALAGEPAGKKTTYELELDPYYSAFGVYNSLTGKPIPHMQVDSELEIYKELIKNFYLPRTFIIEASVNPLPYAGTLIKKHQPDFYHNMQWTGNFNAVRAVTAGFEEPWALSFFFGNVVSFDSIKKAYKGKRNGYSGMLINIGNYHIKDNTLVKDNWIETEAKLKGEQILATRELRWSFRGGMKFHANKYIADSFYLGFRRSRTDFKKSGKDSFWLHNSGFEYVSDFSQKKLEPIRHYFVVEKKFPFKNSRAAFTMGLGFVWTANKKYSGPLSSVGDIKADNAFQFILRPNLEF
ncbi:MAG: hypothetical protein A2X34_04950 [Elusimicrobia bacterium GWC2_51_8]|nr:MAG: hypothetical protein A2X33_09810 [Elusimicrobia bacterium GWA2_51_34]OGR64918.1 MAG: hypothetical protein A2X34_04950 [Elusimicrobia bacterium GWC2_51_8]HAF95882.1 hypothetical protein [Elusimicrobiota bacterium]HCE97993.1 hypothetical protein [Elusimicrobiota bacterium]